MFLILDKYLRNYLITTKKAKKLLVTRKRPQHLQQKTYYLRIEGTQQSTQTFYFQLVVTYDFSLSKFGKILTWAYATLCSPTLLSMF
ncbi:hypothetical protein Avbf_18911 [Armadillidium vulgare]|nr:hypothetical protein Avbf_18911 [Armadillidium vulgare]